VGLLRTHLLGPQPLWPYGADQSFGVPIEPSPPPANRRIGGEFDPDQTLAATGIFVPSHKGGYYVLFISQWGRAEMHKDLELHRFVQDRNIATYIELLHVESESTKRHTLKTLLIDEENKFGSRSEKLDKVERHIAVCQAHITGQHKIIDRLRANGGNCAAAERVLANLFDILDVCRAHRQCVLDALGRTEL
jgi:hypothetical protein